LKEIIKYHKDIETDEAVRWGKIKNWVKEIESVEKQ